MLGKLREQLGNVQLIAINDRVEIDQPFMMDMYLRGRAVMPHGSGLRVHHQHHANAGREPSQRLLLDIRKTIARRNHFSNQIGGQRQISWVICQISQSGMGDKRQIRCTNSFRISRDQKACFGRECLTQLTLLNMIPEPPGKL